MGFLKSLFWGEAEKSEKDERSRNFDMLKYDGIKALRMGKNAYAIRCFNEALKLQEDVEVLECLMNACSRENRMEEAVAAAGRLERMEPDNVSLLLVRADLNYMAEKYRETIADCERVAALEPENPMARFLQGRAEKAAGALKEAVAALSQAIALKEDFAEAFLLRAEVRLEAGEFQEGLQDAEEAVALLPDEENAWFVRGRLQEALGDDKAAGESYRKVIGLNPFNEQVYLQLGRLYIVREQPDQAIALFDEAIEMKPDFARAYDGRGCARLMKGDREGSLADRNKAMELASGEGTDGEAGFSCPDFEDMYKNRPL